jgi:alpha-L-fucosidase 2
LLIPGDPAQWRTVRIIFCMRYVRGWRGARIAGLLNRHGRRAPCGGPWSQRQVESRYENQAYLGTDCMKRTSAGRFVRRSKSRGHVELNRGKAALATAGYFPPVLMPRKERGESEQPLMVDFLPRPRAARMVARGDATLTQVDVVLVLLAGRHGPARPSSYAIRSRLEPLLPAIRGLVASNVDGRGAPAGSSVPSSRDAVPGPSRQGAARPRRGHAKPRPCNRRMTNTRRTMKRLWRHIMATVVSAALSGTAAAEARGAGPGRNDPFAAPVRGFISLQQPRDWGQATHTGNGTMGALVMGDPHDETLHLSHAALYLPQPNGPRYIDLASRLAEIRGDCLAGKYAAAGNVIVAARKEAGYADNRDPFIAAFDLHVRQPGGTVVRYQRSVDFMTGEAHVAFADADTASLRSTFVSRPDEVIVVRLTGTGRQSAELSFAQLPPANDKEKGVIAAGVKSTEQGVHDGFLYYRTLFAVQNEFNPNLGYEGFGRVVAKGGTRTEGGAGITVAGADEVLVLVKIRPLLRSAGVTTNAAAVERELDALPADYPALLAPQAKAQGELMGRVSFSLDAPAADRAEPTEKLLADSAKSDAPLAQVERAFDAGRYNIICSTGLNPPNLQGLWSGTWLAPWSGSFTVNGNLPCAVSFDLMGNTPELMLPYFAYYDQRMAGFRENARVLFGTRGFHVPAQLTVSPRETDFSPAYPHCYWHAGAAWACQFYYDYYRYTGDERFLADRAYPMMREAAAFYEDFLTVTDANGRLAFVPSFSPENSPNNGKVPTSINATMEVAAAKQLLRNAIAAAVHLGRDADLRAKWTAIIARLPDYQVGPDGSFREWLWPGLGESNAHRHASHLYALYDEMPAEIVADPALVRAVEHTIRQRLDFQEAHPVMAFGIVQLGLAAEHVGNADLAQEAIHFLAKGYWSTGMGSFHNRGNLFNMDLSGGLPYLCASALVYADPGTIRFFPARPPRWTRGSLRGVRLRGGVVVRELTWDGPRGRAVLVSDADQVVTIVAPTVAKQSCTLRAGVATEVDLSPPQPTLGPAPAK